jgi:hypothetical protein
LLSPIGTNRGGTTVIGSIASSSDDDDNVEEEGEYYNSNCGNNDDDDGDDVTVILLDPSIEDANNRAGTTTTTITTTSSNTISFDWIEQDGPEMEARRRAVLLRELERVQRKSCIQFSMLCTIPIVLLIIVLITVLGDERDCISDVTECYLEQRTFMNAYTTRCVCEPIEILQNFTTP